MSPVVVLGDRRPDLRPHRRTLADDEVAALLEAMPGLPVPAELASAWPPAAAAGEVGRARTAAWQRLEDAGVLVRRPVSVDDVPSAMSPAVLEALTLPGVADVLLTVRSWAAQAAVQAALAVAGDRGSGVARRWRVDRAPAPLPGLELSAFAAEDVLDEVMRLLPPAGVPPVGADVEPVTLRAVDSAALVAALRDGRDDVARELAARAGLPGVPLAWEDLALRRTGGAEVTLRRPDGAVPGVEGTWWLAGGRWWRAALTGDELLSLVPTTREEARLDLLGALVDVLGAGERR